MLLLNRCFLPLVAFFFIPQCRIFCLFFGTLSLHYFFRNHEENMSHPQNNNPQKVVLKMKVLSSNCQRNAQSSHWVGCVEHKTQTAGFCLQWVKKGCRFCQAPINQRECRHGFLSQNKLFSARY